MTKHIWGLFTLILLTISTQASAISHAPGQSILNSEQDIIRTHTKITSVSLRMRLSDDLHGIVESKMCSFCKTIKIKVTPNTMAYNNNIKVPLKEAISRIGRHATIVYDQETKNVSAIRW